MTQTTWAEPAPRAAGRPRADRTGALLAVRPLSPPVAGRRRAWPQWTLLVILSFLALESILLAFALQGRWFILLAPAVVCASKSWEVWRDLKKRRG